MINATQNANLTTDSVFMINETVNFAAQIDPDSILNRLPPNSYQWEVSGPDMNTTYYQTMNFSQIFNSTNKYTLKLHVSSSITSDLEKNGTTTKTISFKYPITDVRFEGSNFVKNGSLLRLTIVCNGSADQLFCHDFSTEKSTDSCFNTAILVSNGRYPINRYFPESGVIYVNVGIKNDVSLVYKSFKITIFKGKLNDDDLFRQ